MVQAFWLVCGHGEEGSLASGAGCTQDVQYAAEVPVAAMTRAAGIAPVPTVAGSAAAALAAGAPHPRLRTERWRMPSKRATTNSSSHSAARGTT